MTPLPPPYKPQSLPFRQRPMTYFRYPVSDNDFNAALFKVKRVCVSLASIAYELRQFCYWSNTNYNPLHKKSLPFFIPPFKMIIYINFYFFLVLSSNQTGHSRPNQIFYIELFHKRDKRSLLFLRCARHTQRS